MTCNSIVCSPNGEDQVQYVNTIKWKNKHEIFYVLIVINHYVILYFGVCVCVCCKDFDQETYC